MHPMKDPPLSVPAEAQPSAVSTAMRKIFIEKKAVQRECRWPTYFRWLLSSAQPVAKMDATQPKYDFIDSIVPVAKDTEVKTESSDNGTTQLMARSSNPGTPSSSWFSTRVWRLKVMHKTAF